MFGSWIFRMVVELYDADWSIETKEGWNIAMLAAKLGDCDLIKWVLSQKDGSKLLSHKTYNGKTFWDFAEQNKSGAFMNFIRDFHQGNHIVSTARKESPHSAGKRMQKDEPPRRNFNADLHNRTSPLYKLMVKKGYAGRERAFLTVVKNPNNELYLLAKGLGYDMSEGR